MKPSVQMTWLLIANCLTGRRMIAFYHTFSPKQGEVPVRIVTWMIAAIAAFGVQVTLSAANASTLYVQTTPAGAQSYFSPANTLTFDAVAPGVYSSLTQGVLTFTSDTGALHVDGAYIGQYNNFGVNSVHSCYCNDSFSKLFFNFSQPLQGFGFFWGASDSQWTLTAYDAAHNVLDSFLLPITHASNAGDFVGIFGSGIVSATLSGPSSDYVFVDNVTFGTHYIGPGSTVPEPAAWALMVAGFGLVGSALRRRAGLGNVVA